MVDSLGRWFQDFPGQQPQQDPQYMRMIAAQQARMQQPQMPPMVQQPAPAQQIQPQPQVQPVQQPQTPISGGFVPVRSEQDARNWPISPGCSVTFIDENAPYCYTKTMGLSQLDRPEFTRYRLVKEDEPPAAPTQPTQQAAPDYALKTDLLPVLDTVTAFRDEITRVKSEIEKMQADLYGKEEKEKE